MTPPVTAAPNSGRTPNQTASLAGVMHCFASGHEGKSDVRIWKMVTGHTDTGGRNPHCYSFMLLNG